MTMTDDELVTELAENAFIAYGNTVGWVNVAGKPMPQWAELGDTIRDAWKAATARICADLLGMPAPSSAPGLVQLGRLHPAQEQLAAVEMAKQHMIATAHAEGLAARAQQIHADLAGAGVGQLEQGRPYQGGILDGGKLQVGADGKLTIPEKVLPGSPMLEAIEETAQLMRDQHRLDTSTDDDDPLQIELPPKWSQPLTPIREPLGDPGRGQYDDSDGGDVDM